MPPRVIGIKIILLFSCTSCKQTCNVFITSFGNCFRCYLCETVNYARCYFFSFSRLLPSYSTWLLKRQSWILGEDLSSMLKVTEGFPVIWSEFCIQKFISGFLLVIGCLSRFSTLLLYGMNCCEKTPTEQPHSLNWTESKYFEDGY